MYIGPKADDFYTSPRPDLILFNCIIRSNTIL